jgi:ADP-ribose pyrophosphatase YjhB (NUDIX family)
MPHIHTEPGQHDSTVSAYIVRRDGAEPALVLHKHKKLNVWLQFGGHVELAENPWEALTHEVLEESGYTMQQLKILQPVVRLARLSNVTLHPSAVVTLTHPFNDLDHHHTDTAYAFVTHEQPAQPIADGESAHVRAFTAAELTAIPAAEIPENVREIGLFVLGTCLANWIEVDTGEFSG